MCMISSTTIPCDHVYIILGIPLVRVFFLSETTTYDQTAFYQNTRPFRYGITSRISIFLIGIPIPDYDKNTLDDLHISNKVDKPFEIARGQKRS